MLRPFKAILHPEELASLNRLARERENAVICGDHCRKFIQSGFADFHAGPLLITILGRAKLIEETTRANWLLCVA